MKHYVIGKNSVQELVKHAPERVIAIITSHTDDDPVIKKLLELKKPLHMKNLKKLDELTNSTSHQGYVLEVKKRESLHVEELLERSKDKKRCLVVMLDSIFDPHNVGAILRACECFGVDGVIYSKNKGCKITPTVTKISMGASEIVPITEVSNLATTIEKFQKEGFWAASAEISSKATSIYDFDYPEKTLLILGSEGKGVQNILSKKSDFHVYIPMSGQIDSLNVSQAAAVFIMNFKK
ncbi:MAG: putative TrmH family tRNA/rRNA methyltransferase [Chlamydiia bacterium]|nr:putative TrmH family tRNA/rRNA methyltransferase [Chlamydiia bacterium]MCH9618256.1 putative TrmH family tRNA/rRNA methyltransferase [Chlamydiia bacterium]MCH9624652.1 putative TrmH family tRNA/rRNA methyltransferase [Chlamydiia bacterium]